MDDTTFIEGSGLPAVAVKRWYPHPVERVWRAVTEPEHIATWFPSEVAIDLQPGGEVRYLSFEGDAGFGRVLELEPGRRLVLSWASDRLSFALEPQGTGTLFTLTHEFTDRYGAASFATGWETCLEGLRGRLVGEEPREFPGPASAAARHEELLTRFGLDQPEVTRSDENWEVRFERQLTCPADVAWNLFFGMDPQTGAQRTAPPVGEAFRPYAAPEVVLGTVTERNEPRLFAFDVAAAEPGDHVRLEFGEGTGQGVRLVLDIRGADAADLDTAIAQWGGGAVAGVARQALRLALETARAQ